MFLALLLSRVSLASKLWTTTEFLGNVNALWHKKHLNILKFLNVSCSSIIQGVISFKTVDYNTVSGQCECAVVTVHETACNSAPVTHSYNLHSVFDDAVLFVSVFGKSLSDEQVLNDNWLQMANTESAWYSVLIGKSSYQQMTILVCSPVTLTYFLYSLVVPALKYLQRN